MVRITVSSPSSHVGGVVRRLRPAGPAHRRRGAAVVLRHSRAPGSRRVHAPGSWCSSLLLLAPPAFLLFFAQGVAELVALPERLRRLPGEGQERVAELTRLAGRARTTRARGVPLLLWRLRGRSARSADIAGFALPLRVLTPGLLGLTALAAFVCLVPRRRRADRVDRRSQTELLAPFRSVRHTFCMSHEEITRRRLLELGLALPRSPRSRATPTCSAPQPSRRRPRSRTPTSRRPPRPKAPTSRRTRRSGTRSSRPAPAGTRLTAHRPRAPTTGRPVANALIDWWQCDARGDYDNSGYRFRGHQFTDARGRYTLLDGRAGPLSGPHEAHPREGAGAAPAGADDAALLPGRRRQPQRRHLRHSDCLRPRLASSRTAAASPASTSSWTSNPLGSHRVRPSQGRPGAKRPLGVLARSASLAQMLACANKKAPTRIELVCEALQASA